MEDRRALVLRAIIESFITSAEPIGSDYLFEEYGFGVSSATIRNDMSWLEKEGLIFQPHTSAGRVPTDEGFRQFVDDFFASQEELQVPVAVTRELKTIEQVLSQNPQLQIEEKIYYSVSVLARMCNVVSFATLPWRGTAYYLGLANVLRSPEFHNDMVKASTVIEIMEDKEHFLTFLKKLNLGKDITVYIGKENLLKEIQSCSLIATSYTISPEYEGVIGLLGPKRMDYKFNIATLNAVRNDL